MFGHSLGGVTTASAMYEDQRIMAGLSIDGDVTGPVVTAGLDRPYLLMDLDRTSRRKLPELETFWTHLRGRRLNLATRGAAHISLCDLEVLLPQAAPLFGWTPAQLTDQIGTLAPQRATAVQRAYPTAFFDLTLRHRGHLLDEPSRRFPDVVFIP